jgi:hypothetical protein
MSFRHDSPCSYVTWGIVAAVQRRSLTLSTWSMNQSMSTNNILFNNMCLFTIGILVCPSENYMLQFLCSAFIRSFIPVRNSMRNENLWFSRSTGTTAYFHSSLIYSHRKNYVPQEKICYGIVNSNCTQSFWYEATKRNCKLHFRLIVLSENKVIVSLNTINKNPINGHCWHVTL